MNWSTNEVSVGLLAILIRSWRTCHLAYAIEKASLEERIAPGIYGNDERTEILNL